MPLDLGTGLKLLDYIVKYAKPLKRGLDFFFRDDPVQLKLEAPPPAPPQIFRTHTSEIITFVPIDQGKIIYIASANVGWNDYAVTLEFSVDDPENDRICDAIDLHALVLVAHRYKTVMCKRISKERYITGHKTWFKFSFDIIREDFTLDMLEHASRPEHFRGRARRLLFNELPGELPQPPENFGENAQRTVDYLNTVLREIQISGKTRVTESPLPDLYSKFHDEPERFLEIAWIQLAMDLQATGIVTEIGLLELELEGTRLYINLRATRHDDDMCMEGYCELGKVPQMQVER